VDLRQIRNASAVFGLVLGCLPQLNAQAVLDTFASIRTNAIGGSLWPVNPLNLPMTTSAANGIMTATSGAVPLSSIVVTNNVAVATVQTGYTSPWYPFVGSASIVIAGATVAPQLNNSSTTIAQWQQNSSTANTVTFGVSGVPNGTYTESTLIGTASFFFFFLPINSSPYAWTAPCTNPSNCTYAQSYIQNGTWSANFNRLSFQLKCTTYIPRTVGGSDGVFQFGTYIRHHNEPNSSAQGTHYYHESDMQIYPNTWVNVVLNRTPQHCNICGAYDRFQEDPEYWFPQLPVDNYVPDATHYWDDLTSTYVDGHFGGPIDDTACQVTPYTFSLVTGEPDSHINTFASTYNGSAYEVNFNGPAMVSGGETYTVAYSTSGSMHANGLTTGTNGGTVTGYNSSPFLNVGPWISPNMPQAPTLWVAFRPAMPIQGVTGNGVSPIIVTSQVNPNLATGDQITVAGVMGNTAANGTWIVTELTGRDFKFSDGSLVSIAVASNVATATTGTAHGLLVGQIIAPKSTMIGGGNLQNYNGQGVGAGIQIIAVPSSTTFQFTTSGVADGTYTVSSDSQAYIFSFFATSLNGSTGNGAYTGGGTMTATSNTKNFAEVVISSLCDLNSDGVYNAIDVSLETNEALGLSGCQNDIDGDGRCSVADVQRVINAANTGVCRVGP
jgi:hypothetical protein